MNKKIFIKNYEILKHIIFEFNHHLNKNCYIEKNLNYD